MPDRPLPEEPTWPLANGRRVVLLLDASSALERRLLDGWIRRQRPEASASAAIDAIPLPASRRRRSLRAKLDPHLEAALAEGDDPLLAPLRIAWLPREQRDGSRSVSWRDLLRGGDPRDPPSWRQHLILARDRARCRIVAGEPAPLSELRQRWRASGGAEGSETTGLAEYVARQAELALERAERRLRGARYKVPRLVAEDILARPSFRGGLARLARQLGRPEADVAAEAARDLREIAAAASPTMIDLAAQLFRFLWTRAYDELCYDRGRLEEVAALSQRHPVVYLPTHKSNLDHPALQWMLYENGLPPNHTAGGINMNFFPIGPLVRRAGVFFIRRSFKDDEVYKLVLHHYIDYLIEKRFSLEWYIEGGRSRSGKLLPPRFGLLAYVVDAYRRGRSEDVYLIPVSIAYDQIQDVGDYVAEQRGAAKHRESFGWFVGLVRRLQPSGRIHVRFGEPLSLAKALGPPDPTAEPNPDEQSLELQKLAFDVCVRINQATPITATSLVTLALLGVGDQALTIDETVRSLERIVESVERRELPTVGDLELRSREGVRRALDELVHTGVVASFSEGPEAVYRIADGAHLAAAYYRNTVIHFFVTGAIAELALLFAAGDGVADRRRAFFDEALRLRDLLKFEFFFPDRERFLAELRREIAGTDPDWERRLDEGPEEIYALVRRFRPLAAHRVARPFLESYRIVADALVHWGVERPVERPALLANCLALGKQYTLQRRIHSAESVSKSYFETALRLADNYKLLGADGAELDARRRTFAAELAGAVRRIDAIDALAAARRAGVAD
ncbi:MAG TPA: glycerol-3-phosphate 1-O-acyltransferase [Myxococcota bacterium]|nr:glycerol-3-phosphate 1-O-acyltransferase [Myxococcota bacterium]